MDHYFRIDFHEKPGFFESPWQFLRLLSLPWLLVPYFVYKLIVAALS